MILKALIRSKSANTMKSGSAAAKDPAAIESAPIQAVARECVRPLMVGDAVRQHGMLERHQHAKVAGRRIDRAGKSYNRDEREMIEIRKRKTGGGHQDRAAQKQITQVVPRCEEPDGEGNQRGSQ